MENKELCQSGIRPESQWLKWIVLLLTSITLVSSYFLMEAMAPLMTVLEKQMGWTATEFGILHWSYSWFIVFLFGLIIGGILIDKLGLRVTGVMTVIIMLIGAMIKFYAVSRISPGPEAGTIMGLRSQVFWMCIGYATFAVGSENICSICNTITERWFRDGNLALAMGLTMSFSRLGMTASLALGPWISSKWSLSTLLIVAIVLLLVGFVTYILYIFIDIRHKKRIMSQNASEVASSEGEFKLSDLKNVVCNKGWWLAALVCLTFYCSVITFLKYSPSMMTDKYGVSVEFSGFIPSLLPFEVIFLTPLFGALYDRYGKGSTFLMVGTAIIVFVFFCFAMPILRYEWFAILLILILGIAYALVPATIWPLITKIVPSKQVGSAIAFTFWLQNLGLGLVPLFLGWILSEFCIAKAATAAGEVTQYYWGLPMMVLTILGTMAFIFSYMLKRVTYKSGFNINRPRREKK